jgi:hypothetical protein
MRQRLLRHVRGEQRVVRALSSSAAGGKAVCRFKQNMHVLTAPDATLASYETIRRTVAVGNHVRVSLTRRPHAWIDRVRLPLRLLGEVCSFAKGRAR